MVAEVSFMKGCGAVGIGFRPALASALLATPSAVDFVEVVAEACRDAHARREAAALAETWPVIPHGVKLSLGSAEGIDAARAQELGRLARELRAPVVTEHVAFVRAGGREIGHLTELPLTREAVKVVARNVDELRRHLPDVPLLLENVARGFLWRAGEMSEGDFHAEVARATGCDLLLDIGNLYANAVNARTAPEILLASYPLERVAMLHVAGGMVEDSFYFDTHAHPVSDAVFSLVERALAAKPGVPVLLERDAAFHDVGDILGEVEALRLISTGAISRGTLQAAAHVSPEATIPGCAPGWETEPQRRSDRGVAALLAAERPSEGAFSARGSVDLLRAQTVLAEALTSVEPTSDPAVLRARRVLVRKRADDALPLLPTLGPRIRAEDALALGRLFEAPRLTTMTAVADAMRIAMAARDVPELARAAAHDELLLRARFTGGPGAPAPRTMPFIGRSAVQDEGTGELAVWALKGFGPSSRVRLMVSGGR